MFSLDNECHVLFELARPFSSTFSFTQKENVIQRDVCYPEVDRFISHNVSNSLGMGSTSTMCLVVLCMNHELGQTPNFSGYR